jgi:hypothetical protein
MCVPETGGECVTDRYDQFWYGYHNLIMIGKTHSKKHQLSDVLKHVAPDIIPVPVSHHQNRLTQDDSEDPN